MIFRVYIKPFDSAGNYVEDWIEVTDDVDMSSMTDVRQVIDDDQYDVGVFKFNDFNLKLANEHGLYSDVDVNRSIFRHKRSDSMVKLTWQLQDFEPDPGVIYAGESIAGNDEIEVFIGLLSDEASSVNIKDQVVDFKIRGLESVLSREVVPFAEIANGDLVSDIIKASINQPLITELLSYDATKINPGLDVIVDDVSSFENATVKEMLDDILLISNSVFYIKDGIMHCTSRAAGSEVAATFYGQASNNGIENIIDINSIKTGTAKIFNFITWKDTSLSSSQSDSVLLYGVRKKQFDFEQITDNTRRQDILDEFRDEFALPKESLVLVVPATEEFLNVKPLDKVIVDYPTVLYAQQGESIPIYGVAKYGQAVYPFGAWSLKILTTDSWKIMGRAVDTKNHQIEFILRKV